MFVPKKIKEQQDQPNNSSPYAEMTKSIMQKSKTIVANSSSSRVIADIVLKAVMTEKQQWRYLAGAEAERLFETKTKMGVILNLKNFSMNYLVYYQ